jgi:hypothetical protein
MVYKEYIEREALNVGIHESWQSNPHNNPIARQTHNHEHRHFLGLLYKQPTADVEVVRHGEWEQDPCCKRIYYCSECGRYVEYDGINNPNEFFPYCHCGAKMNGKGEV